MHLDAQEKPAAAETANGAGNADRYKEPEGQPEQINPEQRDALDAELLALREENRALKEKLEEAKKSAALLDKTAEEKEYSAAQQLKELKSELTDAVYLLVSAYEAATEKIDQLLTGTFPKIEGQPHAPTASQDAAGAAALSPLLPGGTDEQWGKLAENIPDALPEEKKRSIIEALKNSARPPEHVKPALAVTHKERANAKHLLQKYSKIK